MRNSNISSTCAWVTSSLQVYISSYTVVDTVAFKLINNTKYYLTRIYCACVYDLDHLPRRKQLPPRRNEVADYDSEDHTEDEGETIVLGRAGDSEEAQRVRSLVARSRSLSCRSDGMVISLNKRILGVSISSRLMAELVGLTMETVLTYKASSWGRPGRVAGQSRKWPVASYRQFTAHEFEAYSITLQHYPIFSV